MTIRKPNFAGQVILISSALWLAATANAGLKDKPPKGLDLTGTHWQIDPYRSDDPEAVLDKARDDMRSSRGSGHHRGGMNRGGGGVFGGGGGGGFPGGGGGGGGRHGGGGFPGTGGGGYGQGSDGGSSDDEPGSGGSGSQPTGTRSRPGGSRGQMFSELNKNPERLGFAAADRNLKVLAGDTTTECAAGAKVAISDAQGDGERNCGWDGRAWVVETTRGKSFTRTDRYELSKDGKTLTYLTTASGSRAPKIKITRVYTVATNTATPLPTSAPPDSSASHPT